MALKLDASLVNHHISILRALLFPTLKELYIRFDTSDTASLVQLVHYLSSAITYEDLSKLSILNGGFSSDETHIAEPELLAMIYSAPRLVNVAFTKDFSSRKVLEALGHAAYVQIVKLEDWELRDADTTVEGSYCDTAPHGWFPSIVSVTTTWSTMEAILLTAEHSCACIPSQVHYLEVTRTSGTRRQGLTSFSPTYLIPYIGMTFSASITVLKLELNLLEDLGHDEDFLVRGVLCCASLEELEVVDGHTLDDLQVEQMAKAWTRLRRLSWYATNQGLATYPQITLAGLAILATSCSNLQYLNIAIVVSTRTTLAPSSVPGAYPLYRSWLRLFGPIIVQQPATIPQLKMIGLSGWYVPTCNDGIKALVVDVLRSLGSPVLEFQDGPIEEQDRFWSRVWLELHAGPVSKFVAGCTELIFYTLLLTPVAVLRMCTDLDQVEDVLAICFLIMHFI